MEIFSVLLAICEGNSPVTGEFPAQKPVTRSFDVFFDVRLNKPLSKQSWGGWFEMLSRTFWRHCNDLLEHSFGVSVTNRERLNQECKTWTIFSSVYNYAMQSITHTQNLDKSYSALSIYRGHFSLKNSQKTPHSSPVRAMYMVAFASAKPDRSFTTLIVMLCPLSYYIWLRYIESQ